MLKVSTGKAYKGTGIGDPQFVVSLATALKQTPFELSYKTCEASRVQVRKLKLVLNIPLSKKIRRVMADKGEDSSPPLLRALASGFRGELACKTPCLTVEKVGKGPTG